MFSLKSSYFKDSGEFMHCKFLECLYTENIFLIKTLMYRKLYALFILIWAFWALLLVYLYFFVYYTAVLEIETNVTWYEVELFSQSTALKSTHNCPENICIITDVSPLEYTMTLTKEWYQDVFKNIKVIPRKIQKFELILEKQAKLTQFIVNSAVELTPSQIIQAKRDESRFYVYFDIGPTEQITFTEVDQRLTINYSSEEEIFELIEIDVIPQDVIYAEKIGASDDIFIKLGSQSYIFSQKLRKLIKLPFEIEIMYIKPGNSKWEYFVVTDSWTFTYDISDNSSEYQYLFKDFVNSGESVIGIVFQDEEQKKQNFDLDQAGNLIIQYSQDNKERKILYGTTDNIDRIEKFWEKIIITSGNSQFELENF